jgi:hypothetical protein
MLKALAVPTADGFHNTFIINNLRIRDGFWGSVLTAIMSVISGNIVSANKP